MNRLLGRTISKGRSSISKKKKSRTKSWPVKAAHVFIIVSIDSGILRQIPASSDRHSAKGVNSMVTALCFVSEVYGTASSNIYLKGKMPTFFKAQKLNRSNSLVEMSIG